MACSAVLLPAPLGPIRPTMRPASTVRFTPSRAVVWREALRRPRGSMQGLGSALPAARRAARRRPPRGGRVRARAAQQLAGQAQPLDGGADLRPLLGQEFLALALQ